MFLSTGALYELFYKGDEVYVVNSQLIGAMCIEEESGYDPDNQINGESVVTVLKGARPGDRSVDELEPGPSIEFTDVQEQSQWITSPDSDMAIIVYTQEELQQVGIRGEIIGYGTPPEKLGWYKHKGNAILVLDTNSRIPDAVAMETVEVFNCNAREFISYVLDSQVYAHTYLRQLFPNLIIPDSDPNTMHLSDYCSWSHRLYKIVDDEKLALNPGLKRVAPDVRKSRVFREALKMLENERFDIERVIDGDRIITEHEKVRIGDLVDYQ
ncbi:hypothetical protein SPFM20_00296 [Salmonella phage SPFM20]|nr:hypothetical protein SPFM8_00294 [Salmonella phage SPFM8]VFR14974.1 hypothetical protein SPFM20_00296 [Salmonella phage SPFM20]